MVVFAPFTEPVNFGHVGFLGVAEETMPSSVIGKFNETDIFIHDSIIVSVD